MESSIVGSKLDNKPESSVDGTLCSPTFFLPPPPPPPLPSPSQPLGSLSKVFSSQDSKFDNFRPEYLRDYPFELPPRIVNFFSRGDRAQGIDFLRKRAKESREQILAVELKTRSLIQCGPTCGITAALMLTDINDCDVISKTNQIVLEARKLGYTTFGEMFYATDLAQLIETLLKIPAQVMYPFSDYTRAIVEHLLNEKPILIAYDYSPQFNTFTPRGGAKAHWALIIGFYYVLPTERASILDNEQKQIFEDLKQKYELKILSIKDKLKFIFDYDFNQKSLYFFARHSKTNHICFWNHNELIENNQQLENVASKYLQEGLTFKIPSNGDIRSTLAQRFILVDKKFQSWEEFL